MPPSGSTPNIEGQDEGHDGENVENIVYTLEGVFNTKLKRVKDMEASVDLAAVPPGYRTNSVKEELCLEYVDNFLRQYKTLFPHRKPLFVTPVNEFGVRKLACTTIRPTQLPHKKLYNYDQCAQFLSNYIQYEPLQRPTKAPEILSSPTVLLDWQVGDAFDISTLLCSYLIGAGYDAYCVSGYAPKRITLLDRTKEICPLLREKEDPDENEEKSTDNKTPIHNLIEEKVNQSTTDESEAKTSPGEEKEGSEGMLGGESKAAGNEDLGGDQGNLQEGGAEPAQSAQSGQAVGNPYAIKSRGLQASEYLIQLEEEKRIEEEQKSRKFEIDEEEDEEIVVDDPLDGERVHCWILIRAGKRGVKEDFFIEPTTGETCSVRSSSYQGVESVWNNQNYWVNMQENPESSSTLSFNLSLHDLWEYIFIKKESNLEDQSGELMEETAVLDVDEDEGKDGEEEDEKNENILDLPPSWVKKVILSRDEYRRNFGKTGHRTQLFLRSKIESYAEHLHSQGMVTRLSLFKDKARTIPLERRELFKNRRDKLVSRFRYPLENKIVENFSPGRASDLKETVEIVGKRRALYFYHEARLDGLVSRVEEIGGKIIETYEGRDDNLISRTIKVGDLVDTDKNSESKFGSQKTARSKGTAPKNTMVLPRGQLGDSVVLKMTERFSRNEKVNADSDVAKRTFCLENGTIKIIYHYEKGKIIRSSRIFYKNGRAPAEVVQADEMSTLRPSALEEEFQKALQLEKDLYQAIRDTEREMQDIVSLRKREEQTVVLEKTVFESAREKAKETTASDNAVEIQEKKDERQVDYLTPFLQKVSDISSITLDEAETARNSCLKAMKERLLERANIIQCRLDEENAQLAKKQAAFQRSRDHVEGADEEFERFCADAMFRIQILEQRLAQHEETALQKYANMDKRLRQDPRLSILSSK